jgi:hypothetical protein
MLTTYQEAKDMNSTRRVCDGARAPSPCGPLRARVLAAAIAASAALALAGCGGSSPSTTSTGSDSNSSAGSSQSVEADALKFARCMRAHGISNFADPTNGGQLTIPPGDKNSPAFDSASHACASLMPGAAGVGPSGQKRIGSRAQELDLAKCIRAHGVPNFPDPTASGAIPPGSVNPNSPALKAALQACRPAGRPPQAP